MCGICETHCWELTKQKKKRLQTYCSEHSPERMPGWSWYWFISCSTSCDWTWGKSFVCLIREEIGMRSKWAEWELIGTAAAPDERKLEKREERGEWDMATLPPYKGKNKCGKMEVFIRKVLKRGGERGVEVFFSLT